MTIDLPQIGSDDQAWLRAQLPSSTGIVDRLESRRDADVLEMISPVRTEVTIPRTRTSTIGLKCTIRKLVRDPVQQHHRVGGICI